MSNPFLRSKQQSVRNQPSASSMNPMGARIPPTGGFSAPPPSVPSAMQQPGFLTAQNGNMPPPPPMATLTQQRAGMNLNAPPPPTSSMPPPPTTGSKPSYLHTRGGYQVPTNAYQFGTATSAEATQSTYYAAEAGSGAPSLTPSYLGSATSYDSSAPAPAAIDPSCQPDEEYMKLTYEIAPNSPSLEGMTGMPFACILRPMAPEGVMAFPPAHA